MKRKRLVVASPALTTPLAQQKQAELRQVVLSSFTKSKRAVAKYLVPQFIKLKGLQFAEEDDEELDDQDLLDDDDEEDDPEEVTDVIDDLPLGHIGALATDMATLMVAMAVSQASESLLSLGITRADTVDRAQAAARKFAVGRAKQASKAVTFTTEKALRQVLRNALQEGWSPQQLEKQIQDAYIFSADRASVIATMEIGKAKVKGAVRGWRASRIVSTKAWVLDATHDRDDICDDNADAGSIGLEETFPSGDWEPPAHPYCVCELEAEQ